MKTNRRTNILTIAAIAFFAVAMIVVPSGGNRLDFAPIKQTSFVATFGDRSAILSITEHADGQCFLRQNLDPQLYSATRADGTGFDLLRITSVPSGEGKEFYQQFTTVTNQTGGVVLANNKTIESIWYRDPTNRVVPQSIATIHRA